RVYATLNGYRFDDFKPYIYMSEDYGNTWKNIGASIPTSPINVIIEHPEKDNILFTGTDNATYISTDTGKTWNLLTGGMPPVAVHDLKIQPEENHLLVGTHGRSIYLVDLNALEIIGNDFAFAKVDKTRASSRYGSKGFMWSEGPEPSIELAFYSPAAAKIKIEILNENGKTVQELTTIADKGLNFYEYDGSISKSGIKRFKDTPKTADNGKTYLPVGKYTVKLSGAMGSVEQMLEMVE
ncbi:glycosyl hydrolase, partial [Nonlabens mediterrranea]|nr:glycosyl hydrolase [Nonlabens mediterrranea]